MWILVLVLVFLLECIHDVEPLRTAVTIGGGVGGLVASTILAREEGFRVVLVEKHDRCGGRMDSEDYCLSSAAGREPNLYRWDRGPSLLLLPDVYIKTFELLGEDINDHIKLLPVAPLYKCYFEEDGSVAEISLDELKMEAAAVRVDGENGYRSFRSYMQTATDFLSFGLPTVIEEQLQLQYLKLFILACLRAFPLFSHDWMLGTFFKTQKMKAMMSFQDLYIGLSPYEAPAVFALLQALELERGIYYPQGGFAEVARSLERIALKNGVDIQTKCNVLSMSSTGDVVNSVTVATGSGDSHQQQEERTINGDIFITNIDAPQFEQSFVKGDRVDTRTATGRPSCGVVSINLALDKELASLAHHTLFLSKEYKDSWKAVEDPDGACFDPQCFNFYVHAPSRTDQSACPVGHDAITVLVPVPPLPTMTTTKVETKYDLAALRKAVLDKLQEMEDEAATRTGKSAVTIVDSIVAESVREPADWKSEFNLFRGSAFGLAHSLDQLSVLRARLRHPNLKNLYRVGASTRPGNGVPLVMIGARLTSEAILRDHRKSV